MLLINFLVESKGISSTRLYFFKRSSLFIHAFWALIKRQASVGSPTAFLS